MDLCDSASQYEAVFFKSALANQQLAAAATNEETGFCLYCGEPLDHPGKFCSKECRDDYEHEQKVKRISGRS